MKLLKDYPDVCRGINIGKLKHDLIAVNVELKRLGEERVKEFDQSLFKDLEWNEKRLWLCDRCGDTDAREELQSHLPQLRQPV